MKLKYLIPLLLGAFIFVGCGEDDSNKDFTANAPDIKEQFSQAVTAEVTITNGKKIQKNLTNLLGTIEPLLAFPENPIEVPSMLNNKSILYAPFNYNDTCSSSGSETIIANINNEGRPDYVNHVYKACNDGFFTLNGEIVGEYIEDGMSINSQTLTYITDFSIDGLGISQIIKGGSRIEFDQDMSYGSSFRAKRTLIMQIDGNTFGSKDLVYMISGVFDVTYYPVSGREYINNLKNYFEVDPSYDASLTPFRIVNGNLEPGGLFKYIGQNGNKLEVEITNQNEVTVRADENGDGTFDFNIETEVYTINSN